MEIHIRNIPHGKTIKADVSFGCHFIVQLSDRTAAKIPRVFISAVQVFHLFVHPPKIRIMDHGFSPDYKGSFIRNLFGQIYKYLCIVGDDLAHFPVPTGHGF